MAEVDLAAIREQALIDFIPSRRWFGSKSREVCHAGLLDVVPLRTREAPMCSVALAEVRFQPGTHETYQLVVGMREAGEGWTEQVIDEVDGWTVYDGLSDPEVATALVHLIREERAVAGAEGEIEFRLARSAAALPQEPRDVRPLAAEQSNSSIVLDEAFILKAYRRLEAGTNPELEVLHFLSAKEFPNVPTLHGWYGYTGRPLDTTLGILQRFVHAVADGWELALDAIASRSDDFLGRVRRLGEVTGAMHSVLASDSSDPNFAPEEASGESLGLLAASVDEEVERVFLDLPDLDALQPILGRGEEVRDQLRLLSLVGSSGRVIRQHGDYHLGQVLWTGDDWVVLDFEGEPARSLSERRQKRSPLRDVAGMLRSFAYVASAAPSMRGVEPPAGFEERAREEFMAGYLAEVDASLLPPGGDALERLLTVFELEKAVYELRYELDNRPDWIGIPVAGIERLLGAGVP
jgi:trehalose synthase-fused probable maltokinase